MDGGGDSASLRCRAAHPRAPPQKAASQHNLHTIFGSLPTRTLDLAPLGGAIDQNRIGVVDMNKNTPRRQSVQGVQGPPFSFDWHMTHSASAFLPGLRTDHFVIGKQRAVEQDDIRAGEAFAHTGSYYRGSRYEYQSRPRALHFDADIGGAFGIEVGRLAFEIEWQLTRHHEQGRLNIACQQKALARIDR